MSKILTVDDVLKNFGLDFEIKKIPLTAIDYDGTNYITPYFGLLNSSTNEVINTCKVNYHISQNRDIVEMVLNGMKKFGEKLSVSNAGSINGGRRVFIQLKIEGLAKAGGDTIEQYVTIIDSNDGSTSLSVGIGDEFMHCENQFFKFYAAGESKFRHTATIEQKIAELPKLIEIGLGKTIEQVKIYNKFASTPLTQRLAEKAIKEVLELDSLENIKGRSLTNYIKLDESIKREVGDMGRNLLALFNGVTRFTTHEHAIPKRVNGKSETLINGTAYKKAIIAHDFCLEQVV